MLIDPNDPNQGYRYRPSAQKPRRSTFPLLLIVVGAAVFVLVFVGGGLVLGRPGGSAIVPPPVVVTTPLSGITESAEKQVRSRQEIEMAVGTGLQMANTTLQNVESGQTKRTHFVRVVEKQYCPVFTSPQLDKLMGITVATVKATYRICAIATSGFSMMDVRLVDADAERNKATLLAPAPTLDPNGPNFQMESLQMLSSEGVWEPLKEIFKPSAEALILSLKDINNMVSDMACADGLVTVANDYVPGEVQRLLTPVTGPSEIVVEVRTTNPSGCD